MLVSPFRWAVGLIGCLVSCTALASEPRPDCRPRPSKHGASIECTVAPPEGFSMAPEGHSLRLHPRARQLEFARVPPHSTVDSQGHARVSVTIVPDAEPRVELLLKYVLLDAKATPREVEIPISMPLLGAASLPVPPPLAVGDSLYLDTLKWVTGPEPEEGQPVLLVSTPEDSGAGQYLVRYGEGFPGLAVVLLGSTPTGAPFRSGYSRSVAAELKRLSDSTAVVLLDGQRRVVHVSTSPYQLAPPEQIASLFPAPEMPPLAGRTLDCRGPGVPFSFVTMRLEADRCSSDGDLCTLRVEGSTLTAELRNRIPGQSEQHVLTVTAASPTLFLGTYQKVGAPTATSVECMLEVR
ncbi:MAG: hypothetical protein R3F61_38380 [Myxococcota bacterium]